MICPHCDYVGGFDSEVMERVEGGFGGFYRLPIKLERTGKGWEEDRGRLYGCPACNNLFMACTYHE